MLQQNQQSPVSIAGSFEQALALAEQNAQRRVIVFERSWKAVDRARQRAQRAGLDARLSIHHDSARAVFGVCWNAA